MICRNCKFALQGSERFCPNCGAPLHDEKDAPTSSQAQPPEVPEIFFKPVKQDETVVPEIFRTEEIADEQKKVAAPKKKGAKSPTKAPVVLMLILILAVLTIGLFVAAEKLDIAPTLKSYLNIGVRTQTDADTSTLVYSPAQSLTPSPEGGTVKPDINYSSTEAYVAKINILSLRKGPSDAYGLIKSLDAGCQLQITGGTALTDSWIYVYVPSEDCFGWVNAAFVSLYTYTEVTAAPLLRDYPVFYPEGSV